MEFRKKLFTKATLLFFTNFKDNMSVSKFVKRVNEVSREGDITISHVYLYTKILIKEDILEREKILGSRKTYENFFTKKGKIIVKHINGILQILGRVNNG